MSATTEAPALTESDVLGLLRARLTKVGNGGSAEFALLPSVRNDAGFSATRTFDAVAVSLWPSRGFALHCYEVKCSRSDWLRELREPAKAEAAAQCCDYFTIVASGPNIVADGELPPTWGLMVVRGSQLRSVVKAPLLPGADPSRPIPRSFLVPMLRSAGAAIAVAPVELSAARAEGTRMANALNEGEIRSLKARYERLAAEVSAFEDVAGVKLTGWAAEPAKAGAAVRQVLAAESVATKAKAQLQAARAQLAGTLAAIDAAIEGQG